MDDIHSSLTSPTAVNEMSSPQIASRKNYFTVDELSTHQKIPQEISQEKKAKNNRKKADEIIAKIMNGLLLVSNDFDTIIEVTDHLPFDKRIQHLDKFYNTLLFCGRCRTKFGTQVNTSNVLAPLLRRINEFKKTEK